MQYTLNSRLKLRTKRCKDDYKDKPQMDKLVKRPSKNLEGLNKEEAVQKKNQRNL